MKLSNLQRKAIPIFSSVSLSSRVSLLAEQFDLFHEKLGDEGDEYIAI